MLAAGVDLLLAPLAVFLLFAVFLNLISNYADPLLDNYLILFYQFTLCLVISWFVAQGIHTFMAGRYIDERHSHHRIVPGLLRGIISIVCLLSGLGVFFMLQGYSFTGVWISTGLATAFMGFALQQTLGDFFSGIALSLEGSFRIGDRLRLENGTEGKVIDINWRATWLQDWDNTTHVIPNARLAAQGFKNLHGEHHHFHPWYYVKIPADVDPRFAKELLFEAVLNCKYILKKPTPIIRLNSAETLPYTYMIWVAFANYPSMFKGREELYREIHNVLRRAGVTPAAEIKEWRMRKVDLPSAEPPTIQIALKSQDIFYGLDDEEIEQIALASIQLHFDAGSRILLEGDKRDALDIVISGVVESRIKLPSGDQLVAGELLAGQYFGLISMLTGQPSLFEYSAKTDVTLIRVESECMQEVIRKHPDLAERYAPIIKQRLSDAELLRMSNMPNQISTTTLQQIKKFIYKFSRNTK